MLSWKLLQIPLSLSRVFLGDKRMISYYSCSGLQQLIARSIFSSKLMFYPNCCASPESRGDIGWLPGSMAQNVASVQSSAVPQFHKHEIMPGALSFRVHRNCLTVSLYTHTTLGGWSWDSNKNSWNKKTVVMLLFYHSEYIDRTCSLLCTPHHREWCCIHSTLCKQWKLHKKNICDLNR